MELGGFDGLEQGIKKHNVCPLCGAKGHKTSQSKKCPFNSAHPQCDPSRVTNVTTAAENTSLEEAQIISGAADVDDVDAIPFENENLGIVSLVRHFMDR